MKSEGVDPEWPLGEQYLYKQDWGEQLVNKKQSVIVMYDMKKDTFQVIEGIPDGLCPAQPQWSLDGSYIVGVAYRINPRKLGLIYCTNRPSVIFTLDFNQNYEEISPLGKSVKSPIFTPDGKTLIWLQRDAEGPHAACMSLIKKRVPLKTGNFEIIVDSVETEKIIARERLFYGLYNIAFPNRCWASNNRLVLSTNQQCSINTYVINIDSGLVTELQYASGSQVVLDVCEDIILVNRKNFLVPDKLAIGHLPPSGEESSISFEEITTPRTLHYAYTHMCTYMNVKSDPVEDAVSDFSAIYVGPKMGEEKSVPLVVWPHGGPHSAVASNFSLEVALFNAYGIAILFVNYRGSAGTGQASINFLLGKVGQSDVSDCIQATKQALRQFTWLDPNRLALVGGSHGGFLVTHLSGQYPDMFKVVVARNPVIDVALLSVVSDIPDWAFVECGLTYTQVGKPSEDALVILRKASPIQHAHKVKAATLLQIGSKDLRVPASQGIEYFHRLKANGKKVRMNLYDDNHALGNIPNELDHIINSLLWIQEFI